MSLTNFVRSAQQMFNQTPVGFHVHPRSVRVVNGRDIADALTPTRKGCVHSYDPPDFVSLVKPDARASASSCMQHGEVSINKVSKGVIHVIVARVFVWISGLAITLQL